MSVIVLIVVLTTAYRVAITNPRSRLVRQVSRTVMHDLRRNANFHNTVLTPITTTPTTTSLVACELPPSYSTVPPFWHDHDKPRSTTFLLNFVFSLALT